MASPRHQHLEFRLLGPVEVLEDGAPLPIVGARQRAVLAMLLLHHNEVVLRDRLIAGLWGEDPPPTAVNALQVAVHSLRKRLGGRIETRGSGYVLHVASEDLDLALFERLVMRARTEGRGAAARTLRRALALWTGAALADVAHLPHLATEANRLEELRMAAIEERIDADLALGRHGDLVAELDGLVDGHPLRERLHGQLMIALYRCGRQADALETFQRARNTLETELGIDPSPELRELQVQIIRQDRVVAAPSAPSAEADNGLPQPLTRLIGRGRERATLVSLLLRADVRLVTLVGTGGTGKTRLALAVAAELRGEFVDGVCFVDLAAVSEKHLVLPVIAKAIGVVDQPEHSDQPLDEAIRDQLGAKELLLVLDNVEQVPDSAAVVAAILADGDRLKALVTSRVRLRLAGEHAYPVPPLPLPDRLAADLDELADSEAVQLFVARAEAVVPDFRLTDANAAAVAGICRAVDGLPLAIEVAAARSRLFAPATLLARFGERLDLLSADARDTPARHRTVRATLEWSYELLTPEQQTFFRRLGVFAGGADLDAISAVMAQHVPTDAVVDLVTDLVDASLVTVTEAPDGTTRTGMLETVRRYADELLLSSGEVDEIHEAHGLYFLDVATTLAGSANTGGHLDARHRLEREYENLREALGWAMQPDGNGVHPSHRVLLGLRLCNALTWYWSRGGYLAEGRRWLEQAISLSGDRTSSELAASLAGLAGLLATQGHHERARDLAAASVLSWRSLADDDNLAKALNTLAIAEYDLGDADAARTHFEEAVAVARSAKDPSRLASALANLSSIEVGQRNFTRAEQLLRETLAIERDLGDVWGVTLDEHNMAWLLLAMGRIAEAHAHVEGLIDDVLQVDDPELTINLAEVYAAVLAELVDADRAALLLGAAEARREATGIPRNTQQESELQASLAKARSACAASEWQRLYDHGGQQALEDVLGAVRAARPSEP